MSRKKSSTPIEFLEVPGLGMVVAGLSVTHPVFGAGTVTAIARWADGSHTVQVDFVDSDAKWLVPEYARLSLA